MNLQKPPQACKEATKARYLQNGSQPPSPTQTVLTCQSQPCNSPFSPPGSGSHRVGSHFQVSLPLFQPFPDPLREFGPLWKLREKLRWRRSLEFRERSITLWNLCSTEEVLILWWCLGTEWRLSRKRRWVRDEWGGWAHTTTTVRKVEGKQKRETTEDAFCMMIVYGGGIGFGCVLYCDWLMRVESQRGWLGMGELDEWESAMSASVGRVRACCFMVCPWFGARFAVEESVGNVVVIIHFLAASLKGS